VSRAAGQLIVSPIFPKKTDDLFLVIALCKVMTFLAVVSSLLPPFDVVYPVFFSKFSHKNNFIRGHPWMVSSGAIYLPPSDAERPLDILNRLDIINHECERTDGHEFS